MTRAKWIVFIALLAGMLVASGCSIFSAKPHTETPQTASAQNDTATVQAPKEALGRYYDFDDIQVPASLKLDKNRSILFRVGSFKAGVLVFSDNVETQSLINFFVESMAKDNWVLKSTFKYPKVALFFAKKGKTCVINIDEHTFSTDVAIWVAPSL